MLPCSTNIKEALDEEDVEEESSKKKEDEEMMLKRNVKDGICDV